MPVSRLWLVFVCLITIGIDCSARELWVDKESRGGACSDERPAAAVTQSTPWCSLSTAAFLVAPGDTVRVRGGVYNTPQDCTHCDGRAVLQLTRAGTPTQWIKFIAQPGESVILQGSATALIGIRISEFDDIKPSYNEISGFRVRGFALDCISYDAVPDIRLLNLEVTGCRRQAVVLRGAERVILRGSRVYGNFTNGWSSAVDLFECLGGNVVAGNAIWNNADSAPGFPDSEGHGIIMDHCLGTGVNIIENNLIFHNEGWCISVHRSMLAIIRNNTCFRNGMRAFDGGEISIWGNWIFLFNNIASPLPGRLALNIQLTKHGYTVNPASITENNNLLDVEPTVGALGWGDEVVSFSQYQGTNGVGLSAGTITADPRFVDEFGINLRLRPGSPAIDAANRPWAPTTDFAGTPRPAGAGVDIGAFEFVPSFEPSVY